MCLLFCTEGFILYWGSIGFTLKDAGDLSKSYDTWVLCMRRLLSLALAGAMFLSLLGTAYAGNHENGTNQTTHNSVLFATNISVNGTTLTAPDSTHTPSEVSNNLLGFLDSDTETKQSLSFGGNKTSVTRATYVTGTVSLSGNTVTIAAPLGYYKAVG